MDRGQYSFTDITEVADPLFPDWLELYETAFPPREKLLVSTLLRLLEEAGRSGATAQPHFVALQNANGELVGMMMYETKAEQGAAVLWYVAVRPAERGKGLGGLLYQELIRRLERAAFEALLFEVEIPRGKHAAEARRRIAFYRRQGASLLEGIHYLQDVGWRQPPTRMHLMVHPLWPLDPGQAYELAERAFGPAVKQRGRLRLR